MSTKTISEHPAVFSLDSVEHNPEWVDKVGGQNLRNVNLIYEPHCELYYLVGGRYDKYSLIFVDGILREKCLDKAKDMLEESGIVILHDAERTEYQQEVQKYRYRFWRDCGHTVVLTDNYDTAELLDTIFYGVPNV